MNIDKINESAAKYETEAEQDAYRRGYNHGHGTRTGSRS